MKRGRSARRTRKKGRKIRVQRAGSNTPPPLFDQAYAITLQEDFPDRFPRIEGFAKAAGIDLKPWKGVKITNVHVPTLASQGVGTSNYADRSDRGHFNLGIVGAFLAHKKLLEHLATAATGQGTLIFEDDVEIPPDFKTKLAAIQSEVPEDWDILFLDKIRLEGKTVSPHILKLERDMTATKNWGIWSFIVKNSSIKEKILPTLEYMLDVPDIQLNKFAHKLNMYVVQPSIVKRDEVTWPVSSVTVIEQQSSPKV
jgi:hypothetical protein